MATLKLLANLKGTDGATTWAGVTDKPAHIAAGSTPANALAAIGAAARTNVMHVAHRATTAPYAWPARIAGAAHILWIDATDQPPTDPAGWQTGDVILDPGWA